MPDYPSIATAREAAKRELAPSPAELEHGLELHAHSLTIDAYGFSPTSAPDARVLDRAVSEGAGAGEFQDLREEMMMTRHVHDPEACREYAAAWQAAGVTCVFQNAGQEGQAVPRLIKRLARFTFVTDMLPDIVRRAPTPDDIERAATDGAHCLYFSSNGVPLRQAWDSVEEELAFIRVFFQLGVRMMHLTYNRRNMIGDGCAEPADGGLSDFGRAVVAEMNRVGVIVDVAHSGWRTSREAARISRAPVVASHTTACGLHEHIRGKPDGVLRAIADTNGCVGICCIPAFLGGDGGIRALLDHVEYVARKIGVDHVAIGTDHGYTSERTAEELRKVRNPPRRRPPWASFWPPGALDAPLASEQARLSLAWTNWPLFTVGLVQRGFSDDDIRKIIGGNMLRVARDVLNAAENRVSQDDTRHAAGKTP